MRVHDHMGRRDFYTLFDGGSSHNFIHPNMVAKFGLKTQEAGKMAVTVANGGKLYTSTICFRFMWAMFGQEFSADAMILPVYGFRGLMAFYFGGHSLEFQCTQDGPIEFYYQGK